MYTVDLLSVNDIFNISLINLDYKTENFGLNYYLYYFLNYSEDNFVVRKDSTNIAYILGKHEGTNTNYHAHVTALSIAPEYRKCGIGKQLMSFLEYNGDFNEAHFVDLFVRSTNMPAIKFYMKMGYIVYRTILNYYESPQEDAFEMRKALKYDLYKQSISKPNPSTINASDLE